VSTAAGQLAETIRAEGARILATLVRTVGDLHIAEDAVQEAAMRALRQWPVTGTPESPRAWLTVTARRAAIDFLRREGARTTKERAAVDLHLDDDTPEEVVHDDLLRLIFTCAHPALSLDAQVTLALRVLCGLTTTQIASAGRSPMGDSLWGEDESNEIESPGPMMYLSKPSETSSLPDRT